MSFYFLNWLLLFNTCIILNNTLYNNGNSVQKLYGSNSDYKSNTVTEIVNIDIKFKIWEFETD